MSEELERLADRHLAELHERLRQRGFAGRAGYGERPAVLVVDFIKGFTDERCPLAANFDAELVVTRAVLDAARAARIPRILATSEYDAALEEAGAWARKIPSNSWLEADTEWVEIDDRLGRADDDMVMVKKYPSCFFGTDLASRLVSRAVDTVIVAGCTTSGCIRASAVDACSLGFRVIVVGDAVGDRAPLSHRASLFDIDVKYGDVVHSGDVLAYLAALPRDRQSVSAPIA